MPHGMGGNSRGGGMSRGGGAPRGGGSPRNGGAPGGGARRPGGAGRPGGRMEGMAPHGRGPAGGPRRKPEPMPRPMPHPPMYSLPSYYHPRRHMGASYIRMVLEALYRFRDGSLHPDDMMLMREYFGMDPMRADIEACIYYLENL